MKTKKRIPDFGRMTCRVRHIGKQQWFVRILIDDEATGLENVSATKAEALQWAQRCAQDNYYHRTIAATRLAN